MRRFSRWGLAAGFVLLGQQVSLAVEPKVRTWPAWRGADANGSTTEGSYAAEWSQEKNLLWKVKLPGRGCSTPAVWGKRIFVTTPSETGKDSVLCLSDEGKELWLKPVGDGRNGKHRNGSSSNPSPVTDGEHVFAYFKSGNVAGLSKNGKLLWKDNLQKRFGNDTLYWDIGTSPVLTDDHVVVAVMQERGSHLAAFEKVSGKLAWSQKRDFECPREGDHSYTTPIVLGSGAQQSILVWGAEHLTSHRARTGETLWTCAGFNPEKKRNWVAVASHVVAGDIAVVPYGRGNRLAGIRLGGKGDVTETNRLWTREKTGSFVPTPAVYKDSVYVLRDRGEILCIDPKSGETKWSGKLPKHRAKYYASPTVADGKVYSTREDGVVVVTTASEPFKVLAENDMGERMIASPVPVGGRLLLRGTKHLFCVRPVE
ncbi:MAG: PQQ-binding-like beta-propeller repeat protein [Planctomycetota bacterium]